MAAPVDKEIPELQAYRLLPTEELIALRGRIQYEINHTHVSTGTKILNVLNAAVTGVVTGFSAFVAVLGVANLDRIDVKWFSNLLSRSRIEKPRDPHIWRDTEATSVSAPVAHADQPKKPSKHYLFTSEARLKTFSAVAGVAAGVVTTYTSYRKDNSLSRIKGDSVRLDELSQVDRLLMERARNADPLAAMVVNQASSGRA